MKKTLLTTADRQNGSYRSPEVTVTEIFTEGALCMSGNLEGWTEEDMVW